MLAHRIIRGISLAFEWIDNGGELIVFLHGVGADSTAWKPQLKFFSQLGYSVAAIDMRGTGMSQSRDENGLALPITIADFAADVHELILDLGFERAHWIGNSMGGVIIMEALTNSNRNSPAFSGRGLGGGYSTIDKVVLANTFAKYPDSHLLLPRPAQSLKTKSLAEFATERIPFAHRPDIAPEILQASIRAMAAKDVETYLLSWRETWSHDYRAELEVATKEKGNDVLVITGSLDKITPPALGLEISGLIPGAQYHQIENANHLSNLDQPEEFNQVVWEFLKS
ncbi:MAG TPA: alpha/beta fold hydrolase [Candidatus Kapabacteria bacterium]|nr:alpha/beta fold hydrolase [Candidatus Kapabacteria bacterium]